MKSGLNCTPYQICKPTTFWDPEEEGSRGGEGGGLKGDGMGGFDGWEGFDGEVDGGQAGSPSFRHWQAISLNAAGRSLAVNVHLSRQTTALVDKRWRNRAHNRCGPQFPRQNVLRPSHQLEIDWPPYNPNLNP